MSTADTLRQALDTKTWATLVARAALNGWPLWRSDPVDGEQRYFAGRLGMVRALGSLEEVEQFLRQAGAQ